MKLSGRPICLFILVCLLATIANGHESRPGYLQLTLSDEGSVRLLLKIPALGNLRLGLYPNLPANCEAEAEPTTYIIDNAFTERAIFKCGGGLFGQTVAIDGLSTTLTDVLVRVERQDGAVQIARLTPSKTAFVVEATPGNLEVAGTYLALGVNHILGGIDHLLFVLALLILVTNTRTLIWTITAFTAAHSLTLAAATLGIIQVSQAPVEAVIALSIMVVASEIGLPEQSIPLALLLFNIGVELGQLGFIGAILLVYAIFRRHAWLRPQWASVAPAYLIGTVAAYWTIERTLGFWG